MRSFTAFFISFFVLAMPASAIDLDIKSKTVKGGSNTVISSGDTLDETLPSDDSETKAKTEEIVQSIMLAGGKSYKSIYLNVENYRKLVFYVVPIRQLTEPRAEPRYKLDALFSFEADTSSSLIPDINENNPVEKGWEEFGSIRFSNREEKGEPFFYKLTTGETASRILVTKVYGPYVRIVLTNIAAPDTSQAYRVVAYMTR